MAEAPTLSTAMQNQPIEVTRLPLAEPLSQADLDHRIDELVGIIRTNGCDGLARNLAQGIADSRYGGRYQNVEQAFPQLMTPGADGKPVFNSKLDSNGDGKLEGDELTAATLAAGKWLADHPDNKPANVPLDNDFMCDFKLGLSLLSGLQEKECTTHGMSNLPAKPVISNSPTKQK